jgi:3-deoxy-D-manno-octulosonic-acid transferase
MGPHTFNFSDAAELSLAAGAGLREATMAQAVQRAVLLAANRAERDTMAAAAQAFAAQHRGAAARMAAQVLQLL